MSSMVCGKCKSESTYYEAGALACMKCGNRSPSRWGFHRKGEEIKPPEPIEAHEPPELEDEEIEQEEIDDMAKKRTPEQIERIRAGIRAAMARKKAAAGGGQSKVEKKTKEQKPAAAPPLPQEEVARNRERAGLAPLKVEIPDVRMTITPEDPRHVLLDFTLEENKHLYEPWTAYCRKFRRGPGDHAMQLIEENLKAANAL
jgi:hypothetical protein